MREHSNVETNIKGFPYSGSCSMLCRVDVYLCFEGQAHGQGMATARPKTGELKNLNYRATELLFLYR